MNKTRQKALSLLNLGLAFLFVFYSSLSPLRSQIYKKDFIKSTPHVYKTGLLFQNPEWDPCAVQGSAFIQSLGLEPLLADSHTNLTYLPPVDTQGSQGSCVAWAVGYYLKSYQENKENNRTTLAEKSLAANICSPAFIYNMIHTQNDHGSYFSDAFRVLNDFGCASLADMPYDDSDYQSWPDESDFDNAIPQKTQCSSGEYYYIYMGSDLNLEQVKQLVLNGKLVIFGIYVYNNYRYISSYDNTYTIADKTGTSLGGHAQTIVGFDDTKVTNDGTGAFRVVNSWGTDWGDSGFYWISYEAIKYGSGLSQGYALWVDDRAGYTSDKKARFHLSHNYSRETETWISIGGESIDFLDFYVNNMEYEYLSFPSSNIVLDIKDLESFIGEGTTLYLYLKDKLSNGVTGIINDFVYEDCAGGLEYSSYDTPVGVNDKSQDYAPIIIPSSSTPYIQCSRNHLYFGGDTSNTETKSQDIVISNAGGGTLNWSVADDAGWLSCAPASGTETGVVTVSVEALGLSAGTYSGTVTVTDPAASNSPRTVSVTLNVYGAGSSAVPFGSFDTPVDSSTVRGNIPVTGWALDDIEVVSVKVYRDPISGEGGNLVYIGDAVFVEGARPDVEAAYPGYPLNYRGGWGYMMLTNFLPNGGNGTFVIHTVAGDKEGNEVNLGAKTIICDNENAVKPFGAIDTPTQGGTASGAAFVNFGWALTPQPKYIPTDGSTIWVWVDGVPLGHPVYDNYRSDIATLFPGYANSDGAVGYYYLDTTTYENGVHNIAWSVEDSEGQTSGIGSRYFNIFNGSSGEDESETQGDAAQGGFSFAIVDAESIRDAVASMAPVYVKKGYNQRAFAQEVYPDEDGVIHVEIEEVERVALSLNLDPTLLNLEFIQLDFHQPPLKADEKGSPSQSPEPSYSGYLRVQEELRPLPIGSTLDAGQGIFYWQPGPGFLGEYEFVFIRQSRTSQKEKIRVKVSIRPKF